MQHAAKFLNGSDRYMIVQKCCTCAAVLCLQLFSCYECGAPKLVFGVAFLQLVDTLSVFASASSSAPMQLHYPGPDGELQLE
jgi:hypothetical protein